MTIRVQLKPEAVTWLGSAFEQKTPVSPLAALQTPGFKEEDKQSLRDQNILDDQGAMTPAAYDYFKALAEADRFAGFRVSGSFGKIDKIAYFKDDRIFWVDNAGGTFIFSEGRDAVALLAVLNEISGVSHLVNASLDVELDPVAAQCFIALADMTRQAALLAYADRGTIPEGYAVEAILEACQWTGERWLGTYLRGLRLPGGLPDNAKAEAALDALAGIGVVEKTEPGYRLAREGYAMAANLLVIENIFHLRTGKWEKGEVQSGEAFVLQAGLHDNLMMDSDGSQIGLTSISTNALHEYLLQMMSEPPKW